MTPPTDDSLQETPAGWTAEESSDDVRSWLGSEDRVLCVREDDAWLAYAQPRGELGTSNQVPLTEDPVSFEEAIAAAREYMEQNTEAE
jgi:hypothetical protein